MKAADTTLYWAKAAGRGRWAVYDPERSARDIARSALVAGLPAALDRGEFVLHYQPIVSLLEGTMLGGGGAGPLGAPGAGPDRAGPVHRPGRGDRPDRPARRVGAAAGLPRTPSGGGGSSPTPGWWSASTWPPGRPTTRRSWTRWPTRCTPAGCRPELLQLELTESAVMGSAGEPLRSLHRLAALGVRLAMDDFGTGYSNLAYLRRLPIHCLKLAGPFVEGIRARRHRTSRPTTATNGSSTRWSGWRTRWSCG